MTNFIINFKVYRRRKVSLKVMFQTSPAAPAGWVHYSRAKKKKKMKKKNSIRTFKAT